MPRFLIILLSIPVFMHAQTGGIQFEETLNWEQVKVKAQKEHKFIFVDCYTTWCGPCKMMDKQVYPQQEIGEVVNKDFIAVKIQMDSTAKDDARAKLWRKTANDFMSIYKITAFPAFLFFNPDGEAIHKAYGFYEPNVFKALLTDSRNPEKQYYTVVNAYKQNKVPIKEFPKLAQRIKDLGDKELAQQVAKDYKNRYMDVVSDQGLITKENVDFAVRHRVIFSSSDRIFKIGYQNPKLIDTINGFFADFFINGIVTREEIESNLWKNDQYISKYPDWKKLQNNIAGKYNKLNAKILILAAQLSFYSRIQDWDQFVNYRESKIKLFPPRPGGDFSGDAWSLNADAWQVFLHCTDKKTLRRALAWMDLSISLAHEGNDPVLYAYYDTKASLLYKVGRVKEAIATEERAIEIAKSKGEDGKAYTDVLNRMKKNETIYDAKWQ